MKKLLLPVLVMGLLLPVAAPAQAAPKCTRDGAVLLARSGDVIAVGIRRKARGRETRRDDYYACLASTGKRFKLHTSRDFGDDLVERDQFVFLEGRFLGVVRELMGGVSVSLSATTYDVVRRKRVRTADRCESFSEGDARGPQEIVFLPRGGIAYTCKTLWLADAKGVRRLEPDGTDVRQLAVSGNPFATKLYWTVVGADGSETAKSVTP